MSSNKSTQENPDENSGHNNGEERDFKKKGQSYKFSTPIEIALQIVIIISLIAISISTIPSLSPDTIRIISFIELITLIIFITEYCARLYLSHSKKDYIFSFWGIIDFLAIAPAIIFFGANSQVIRTIRLLRLIRIFKLGRYSTALQRLQDGFRDILPELIVFLSLATIVIFMAATGIYFFEHNVQPETFSSIPASLWWALSTLTTVGYGDIYPITIGGKLFTAVILFIGLGLVAVPAGLIASTFTKN